MEITYEYFIIFYLILSFQISENDSKQNYQEQIQKLQRQLRDKNEEIEQLNVLLDVNQQDNEKLKEQLEQYQNQQPDLKSTQIISQLKDEIGQYKIAISDLTSQKEQIEKQNLYYQKELSDLQQSYEQLDKQFQLYKQQSQEKLKQQSDLFQEIEKLNQQNQLLQISNNQLIMKQQKQNESIPTTFALNSLEQLKILVMPNLNQQQQTVVSNAIDTIKEILSNWNK